MPTISMAQAGCYDVCKSRMDSDLKELKGTKENTDISAVQSRD